MAPPSYIDLGKACRDVFDKGYFPNQFRLTTQHKTCGGVGIKSDIKHKFRDATFDGLVECKTQWPEYGITHIQKWFLKNKIFLSVANEDIPVKGLKVEGNLTWNPSTNDASGTVLAKHSCDPCTIDLDVTVGSGGSQENPTPPALLNGSIVCGLQGWIVGGFTTFDFNEANITTHNLTFGRSMGDSQIFFSADNLETFRGSIYHRISNRLESGIMFGWKMGEEVIQTLAVGGKYLLNGATAVRGKINNESILGLGMETMVQNGVTLSMSTEVDMKNFYGGEHKIGLGLDFKQ